MDKRIFWIILLIIILLLLFFLFIDLEPETEIEKDWRLVSSPYQGKTKLHEEEGRTNSINWGDCCTGDIKVELEYMWEFYFEDIVPPDETCHNPVIITLTDSNGVEVYRANPRSPVDYFDDPIVIECGTWDCINPWTFTVINGCLYPINYKWEMTLYCYD